MREFVFPTCVSVYHALDYWPISSISSLATVGRRARPCILRLGNVHFGERASVKQRGSIHQHLRVGNQLLITRVYSQTCFDFRFPDCAKQPNIYVAPMGVKDGHMATDAERFRNLSRREFSIVHVMPIAFPPFFVRSRIVLGGIHTNIPRVCVHSHFVLHPSSHVVPFFPSGED